MISKILKTPRLRRKGRNKIPKSPAPTGQISVHISLPAFCPGTPNSVRPNSPMEARSRWPAPTACARGRRTTATLWCSTTPQPGTGWAIVSP